MNLQSSETGTIYKQLSQYKYNWLVNCLKLNIRSSFIQFYWSN